MGIGPRSDSDSWALRTGLITSGLLAPVQFLMFVNLEATAGIAPAHRGFADPCLAAWLRGRNNEIISEILAM